MKIGDRVRIVDPLDINYLTTGVVTDLSPSGRVQVKCDVNGELSLLDSQHVVRFDD